MSTVARPLAPASTGDGPPAQAQTAVKAPAAAAAEPRFLASTVGRKAVMAVTGIVLFAFVIGHMVGNLQVYLGAEALDAYGEFLRHFLHGAGLWIARGSLLVALVLHVWAAISLTLANRRARPGGYAVTKRLRATYASRTMVWTGPILLLFVLYHLAHFTWGTAHPDFVHGKVYHNVIVGFSSPIVVALYTLAQIALGLHLYHGGWSMLQTLGLSHPRWNGMRFALAALAAAAVVVGNLSIPFAVLAGVVR